MALMMDRSIVLVACVGLAACVLGGCGASLDPALKGYWTFDEGSGQVVGSAVCKRTGQVPPGLKWVQGKKGTALEFNGEDYVVIKACPCLNAPTYTIAAWTKFKNTGDHHYIIWKAGPIFPEETDARRFDLWTGVDGTVHGLVHTADGGEALHLAGAADIADDKWHHVAMSYDGKTVTLTVDGKQEDQQTPTGPLATNDHDLWIGGRPEGVVATGLIDEVRFYTRALSAAELAELAGK